MGKKEQLEEIERQMDVAKKKLKTANMGLFSSIALVVVGFLISFVFVFVGILVLVLVIIYYVSNNNKINQLNLEKAKLK